MKLPRRSVLVVALSLLTALGLLVGTVLASVTLSSFTATTTNGQPLVSIAWETGTELNTSGFFIGRATAPGGTFVRQNPTIIPAQGDGLTGAQYDYLDGTVTVGTTYYYQLEVINNNQSIDTFGPVTVTAGVNATPTPTPGVVLQPTFTFTPTPTPTSTPTRSALATATETPAPRSAATSTPTPTFAAVVSFGETVTPVAPVATATQNTVFATSTAPATAQAGQPAPPTPSPEALPAQPPAVPVDVLAPTRTPLSVAAVPPNPAATLDSVPVAPLVVATQGSAAESAADAGGVGPALLILAAAVLLLGGGLYAILRITSRPS